MSETISKASVCEILADIYPTDDEKVVAVKEVDKAYEAIQQLPPADVQLDTKELVAKIKKGISATNADDVYSCGMRDGMRWCMSLVDDEEPLFEDCPPAQPESCTNMECPYCRKDSDGYVKPLEKNCHAFIRFGMNGWEINLSAKGWHGSAKVMYCPMCGRRLKNDK